MNENVKGKLKNVVEELSSQYLVVLLSDDDEPIVSVQLESEDEKTVVRFEIPVTHEGMVSLKTAIGLIVDAFNQGLIDMKKRMGRCGYHF